MGMGPVVCAERLQEFRVFGCGEKVLRGGGGGVRCGEGGAHRYLHSCRLVCCHEEGMESGPGGQCRTSELKLPKGRLGLQNHGGRPW